ncbi:MAG: helix-turn-helix domain-containing protein [Halobacteriales archaeon]
MPKATLTITIPEAVWIGDLTRRNEQATFNILAALSGEDDTGVGLLKVQTATPAPVLEALIGYDAVTAVDVLELSDESVLIQFETTQPLLLDLARQSGIPLEMPFTIQNGDAVWEITASQDRLSELNDQLTAFGLPFTVDSIYRNVDSNELLTEQQATVLDIAIREGYYDTPRTCTQEDIADRLDLAKSTCSETLHRAEEKVIKEYMGNNPPKLEVPADANPVVA